MSRGKLGIAIAVLAVVAAMVSAIVWAGQNDDPVAAAPDLAADEQAVSTTLEPTPPTPTPTPSASPTQATATATPTPTPTPLMATGSSGDEVRELQARLKQIQWYEPKISGEYDAVTTEAVRGFQGKRGLAETGLVDQKTWDRLVAMTREPTDDEMHNRLVPGPTILGSGDTGDKVRELQARLRQIGWFSGEITPNYGDATGRAVAGFQTKRGFPSTGEVDQRTWDRVVAMTRTPTDDEMHNRKPGNDSGNAALDQRCLTGRALCIDKSTRTLSWVVDGDVRTTMDVRFGSELTPTREGAFRVNFKSRNHVSSIYDTPMPYAMFFSRGQAVHYSPDFAANGYNGASHGCVNVRDKGAIEALFDRVQAGDKVIVYRS